jgi:hypothetical protein
MWGDQRKTVLDSVCGCRVLPGLCLLCDCAPTSALRKMPGPDVRAVHPVQRSRYERGRAGTCAYCDGTRTPEPGVGREGTHGWIIPGTSPHLLRNEGRYQALTGRLSSSLILSCPGFVSNPFRFRVSSASSKSQSFLNEVICFRTSLRGIDISSSYASTRSK